MPWLQTTCFCPFYSPTARSPPTGSRRKSSSGTGAPLRMRWPESGASSSRSRSDWRRSLHFRVRMDQLHTTPCQVNIDKSLNSPSNGLMTVFPCEVRTTSGRIKAQGGSAKGKTTKYNRYRFRCHCITAELIDLTARPPSIRN